MGRRFRDYTIGQKLWALVGLALLGFLLSAAHSLRQLHDNLLVERKAQAQGVVEAAYAVIEHYEAEAATGHLTVAEAQRSALRTLKRMRYGADNYLWVSDYDTRMLMHPVRPDLVGEDQSGMVDDQGKRIVVAFVEAARNQGQGFVEYVWPRPKEDRPVRKIAFVRGFPRWNWVLGSGVYLDDFDAVMASLIRRTLVATLALAALLCLAAINLGRSVAADFHRVVEVARRVARGDMTVRIDMLTTNENGALVTALREMVDRNARVIDEVQATANALLASADRVAAIAHSVLQGSKDQASSSSQSAQAAQQMFATLESNREVARGTDRLAARAVREAAEGRAAVLEAAAEVQLISEKILVIHEIAHQTTLLAHDFSIEETRGGAVHASASAADHVRKLYEQTRTAAQEIGMLAGSSAALVNKACRYLEAIVPSIEKAARQAQTVSTAADEATAHARDVATAEAQLQSISQEHATAAAKLAVEAADVRRRVKELQELVGYFTLEGAGRAAAGAADSGDNSTAALAVDSPPPSAL
jgi:methyl-accepting chemotaxis protein